VDVLAVQVGAPHARRGAALDALRGHGRVEFAAVPAGADRSTVDALLAGAGARRLVVIGDLAGLNLVVLRLLRRGLLDAVPVGAVVDSPQWTRTVGLPGGAAAAARVAATGAPAGLRLLRDDQGGIVLHRATLRPWHGRRLGVRGYVEDAELVNAPVRAVAVGPDAGALRATVRPGLLRPARTMRGRAVTLSCQDARLTVDGAGTPSPRRRVTWWLDDARWQLIRPVPPPPAPGR
jgi:hypothetical protein